MKNRMNKIKVFLTSLMLCLMVSGLTAQRPGAQGQRELLQAARRNIAQYKKTHAKNVAMKNRLASKINAKAAKAKATAAKIKIKKEMAKKKINAAELKARARLHDKYTTFQSLMDQYNKKFGKSRQLGPKGMRLLRRITTLYHTLNPRYQELADIYLQQRYNTSIDNLEVIYLRGGSKPEDRVVSPSQENRIINEANNTLDSTAKAVDNAAQELAESKPSGQQATEVADNALNAVDQVLNQVETNVSPSAAPAVEAQVEKIEAAATKIADTARLVQLLEESDRLEVAPLTGEKAGRAYLVRDALNDTLDDYKMDAGADQELINIVSKSLQSLTNIVNTAISRLPADSRLAQTIQAAEGAKTLIEEIREGATLTESPEKIASDLSNAAKPYGTSTNPVDEAIGDALDKKQAGVTDAAAQNPGAVLPAPVVPVVESTDKTIKQIEAGQGTPQDVQEAEKNLNQALVAVENKPGTELVQSVIDEKKNELEDAAQNAGLTKPKLDTAEITALIDRAHDLLGNKISGVASERHGRGTFLLTALGNALTSYKADAAAPLGIVDELQQVVQALTSYVEKLRTFVPTEALPTQDARVVEEANKLIQDIESGKSVDKKEAETVSTNLDQALGQATTPTTEKVLENTKGELEEALESIGIPVTKAPPVKTTLATIHQDIARAQQFVREAGTLPEPNSMILGRATVLAEQLGNILKAPGIATRVLPRLSRTLSTVTASLHALIDNLRKEEPVRPVVALPTDIAQTLEKAATVVEDLIAGKKDVTKEATDVQEQLTKDLKAQTAELPGSQGVVSRILKDLGSVNEALATTGAPTTEPSILPAPVTQVIGQSQKVIQQATTEGPNPAIQQDAARIDDLMKRLAGQKQPSYVEEVIKREIERLENATALVPVIPHTPTTPREEPSQPATGLVTSNQALAAILERAESAIRTAENTGIASQINAARREQRGRLEKVLAQYQDNPSVSKQLLATLSKTIADLSSLLPGPVILPSIPPAVTPPVTTLATIQEDIARAQQFVTEASSLPEPKRMILGRATVLAERLGNILKAPGDIARPALPTLRPVIANLQTLIDNLRKEEPVRRPVGFPPAIAQTLEKAAGLVEKLQGDEVSSADIKEATNTQVALTKELKEQSTELPGSQVVVSQILEHLGSVSEALALTGASQAEPILPPAVTPAPPAKETGLVTSNQALAAILERAESAIKTAENTGIASQINAARRNALRQLRTAFAQYRSNPSVSRQLLDTLSETITNLVRSARTSQAPLLPGPVILPGQG